MRSNIIIMAGLLLFSAIVFSTLRPVRLQAENKWIRKEGVVTELYKTVFNDVAVKLEGHANIFYINKGLENGISLSDWKNKLLHRPVVIQYSESWTPIKHDDDQHFISSIAADGEFLYRENE